jgi:hypothetical protein
MSGKKSDSSWQPDAVLKLAEDRFLSTVAAIQKAGPAAVLALASDLVYESAYRLVWWQWLFFPILSLRVLRTQRVLRRQGKLDAVNKKVLQRTVAQLQFGKKIPPAHIINLVRQNIVENDFSNWQVRHAFNSPALSFREDRCLLRRQPAGIHRLLIPSFWVFAIVSGLSLSALMIDTFIGPILPIPYNQFFIFFEVCAVATFALYQFGYQWRKGDQMMKIIWPFPVVHSRGLSKELTE